MQSAGYYIRDSKERSVTDAWPRPILEQNEMTETTTIPSGGRSSVTLAALPRRRPVLLLVGPVPPPFIGPAVATDRLIRSSVIAANFDVVHLDTSDRHGWDDIGKLSLRNISIALGHGWRCLRLIMRHRPAVVYVQIDRRLWGFIRDMQFMLAARLFRAELLVHLRAGRFDLRHDFGGFGRVIARLGLMGVSRAIVLGRSVRDVFGTLVPQERIRIVPNGMNLDLFAYSQGELAAREEGALKILYLGNLYPGKGAHVMLKAMGPIVEALPNARLVVAGRWLNSDFRSLCESIVAELGIESNVEFVGEVDAVAKRKLLAMSNALCFTPIEAEGLPWVVLEAMAASLPVVATPQGTIPEVVVDNSTGIIVPSNDSRAVAEAVLRLAREGCRELGRRGRIRLETLYSEPVAHQALVDVALECLRPNEQKELSGKDLIPSQEAKIDANSDRVSNVYEFWNIEACGSMFIQEPKKTKTFYKEYRQFRYETEWHIPELVPFEATRNKEVLEIGCGNGADGTMFAMNGAHYTGVDLTDEAIEATRQHFDALDLSGTFQRENAEHLSFADESFDFVYSHGVLHHTPIPERAFAEVHRVLRPGGEAVIMLYHRNSFNYFVRIMLYMRLRLTLMILLRMPRWKRDRQSLVEGIVGLRGNVGESIYQLHYRAFLRQGWSYLKAANFVHHGTDGPECPYAYVYSARQIKSLFASFANVETRVAHFPLRKYGLRGNFWGAIERFFASRTGWYLFVFARK